MTCQCSPRNLSEVYKVKLVINDFQKYVSDNKEIYLCYNFREGLIWFTPTSRMYRSCAEIKGRERPRLLDGKSYLNSRRWN